MTAALLLSLGSAATFGAADFLGGLASRRAHAIPVAAMSQVVGLLLVLLGVLVVPGAVSSAALGWGAIAGLTGAGGLIVYFHALTIGAMGVTAPMASLVGAALPVGVGLGLGERPAATAVLGVAVGIAATVLVARPASGDGSVPTGEQRRGLLVAAGAGVLFGVFFVALAVAPADSGLWPLVGARVAGIALLACVLLVVHPPRPGRDVVGLAVTSGALDMTANVLFLLAARQGLLVLTSVVTGLYPVGVVVLAWLVLRERLAPSQVVGIGLALAATALIAA